MTTLPSLRGAYVKRWMNSDIRSQGKDDASRRLKGPHVTSGVCNRLKQLATDCNNLQQARGRSPRLQEIETICNSLQHLQN
jgi:hypothetical protein